MAKQQVTGYSPNEVDELRENFEDSPASNHYEFEERYCLYKIPFQPEDYDGPDRRCANTAYKDKHGNYRCKFHAGKSPGMTENMTPGNPKHYMNATDDYLMEHLTDEEQQLYHDILGWAEIYGIDPEEDPASYDVLTLLAKQRVREVKASKYLFEEGEIREKLIRDENGDPVTDDEGELVFEEDTNVISEEYRRLINLIQSLMKDLVMTRKEQAKAEDRNIMADSADTASKAMSELVSENDRKFDLDDYDS